MSPEISMEENSPGPYVKALSNLFSLNWLGKHPLIWVTVIGMTIRLIMGFFLTQNYDVSHWALVVENIRSGNGLYELDGYYYSPPWGYIMAFISSMGNLIGVGDLGSKVTDALFLEQYTDWNLSSTITTISFNMMFKVPLFICDLAVAYVLYRIMITVTDNRRLANSAFALWFLCPLVIVSSAVNCMFDNFAVLSILLCVFFLIKGRYFFAGSMFGLAVLTKFFPVFFIFLLFAYILIKNKDRMKALKNSVLSILGTLSMSFIILLPNIMDNSLSDTFSFLTSRTNSGMGLGLGWIETYGTVIAYSAFLIVSLVLGIYYYRVHSVSESKTQNKMLLFYLLMNSAVLFLYPSTPQYLQLMIPFLIFGILCMDRKFMRPFIVIFVGSTIFSLTRNFILLQSVAVYTDLVSYSTLIPLIELFQQPLLFGCSAMAIIELVGGILQYVGTLYIFYVLYKRKKESDTGVNYKRFISGLLGH